MNTSVMHPNLISILNTDITGGAQNLLLLLSLTTAWLGARAWKIWRQRARELQIKSDTYPCFRGVVRHRSGDGAHGRPEKQILPYGLSDERKDK